MNGRVYDPTLGRFLSADPFVPDPETTKSYNRYSYVHNNPLSYTDPSGFNPADRDIEHSNRSIDPTPGPGAGHGNSIGPTGINSFSADARNEPMDHRGFNSSGRGALAQAIGKAARGVEAVFVEADLAISEVFGTKPTNPYSYDKLARDALKNLDFELAIKNARLARKYGLPLSRSKKFAALFARQHPTTVSTAEGLPAGDLPGENHFDERAVIVAGVVLGLIVAGPAAFEAGPAAIGVSSFIFKAVRHKIKGTKTVGRWMSREELKKMKETGKVQEGGRGQTRVADPSDPSTYGNPPKDDIYVEFDVPKDRVLPHSKGTGRIPGPNSPDARVPGRNPADYEMPDARNIKEFK